ncbi:Na+/H+ antiporter NhaC family protein [Candidatus Enterovibrio escicola]|uniref:Na+/H+ antiporter NhaC family protein n=1 Tax=Candidatus Enterovibrio escicola TaxID=1927127 RepID=UPI001CC2A752|nr:Na+/H+ antiporter NhaC family protein [Candidatus Enterovibrio escacola]
MIFEGFWTLLPPVVAILIAVWKRNAILALTVGIVLTWMLNAQLDVIQGTQDTLGNLWDVVSSDGNRRIIIFSLLIGALLALMKQSGGVNAFVDRLAQKRLVTNQRQASLLPSIIGTSIFTDTNLSMFTAGIASQSLFDKYGMSRARLAFILDSTCSPISILLLINGWGAYVLGLLDGYQLSDTVGVLIDTIFFNFYPIIILVMVYYTAFSTRVFGSMKNSVANTFNENTSELDDPMLAVKATKARYLVIPLFGICIVTIGLLLYSGNGDIRKGSGSWSVMWAVISCYLILMVMLLKDKIFDIKKALTISASGMKDLLPVVVILVLSFAFGDAVKAFGTGSFVSELLGSDFPLLLVAPLLFITAGVMAFATGTSWGTFAVLIPIAMPLAASTGLEPAFLVAAVLGGGIFGDHSSPISDSTIVASMASGCDHIEHVKTQLPYNLVAGALTLIGYVIYVAWVM